MNPKFQDLAFDAVIPSAILFNENLEPSAIKLYAFVRGLTKTHGYCYATNGYLAECMNCDESTIKRLLNSLLQESFIEIETNKDGIHWQRGIFLGGGLKESLRRLKNEPPPAQNQAPPSSKMSHNKRYIKEDIEKPREREKGAAPPPSAPPLFPAFKYIILKKEEFDELVKEFGEPRVMEKIKALNEYHDLKPIEFKKYGAHVAVLRNWINKDLIKNKIGNNTNEASLNEAQKENMRLNEELVNELKADYPDRAGSMSIFYKHHIVKSKCPEFDISLLIGHKEFCRFLQKHLRINILEVRFPNG